jgi:hypothetical protein
VIRVSIDAKIVARDNLLASALLLVVVMLASASAEDGNGRTTPRRIEERTMLHWHKVH